MNRPRIQYTTPSGLSRGREERYDMSNLAEIGGHGNRTDGSVGGDKEGVTHTLPV